MLEGPDNCGKSTQIQKLIHLFHDKSIHQLHYSSVKGFEEAWQTTSYSCKMYSDMFSILHDNYKNMHFTLDRTHLGELVYGPLYRDYTGDYVICIENNWRVYEEFWNEIHLITFIDAASNLISRDDGLSFSIDPTQKQKEINLFINANNKSFINHKAVININNKSEDEVFEEVRKFLKR